MSGTNRLFKSGKTIRLRWNFRRSRIWKKCRIPTGAEIRYSPIYNKWSWHTAGYKSLRITHVNLTGISSSLFFLAYWLILPHLLWFLMSFHISAGPLALCTWDGLRHSHTVDENWEKPTIATAKILCKLDTQLKIKSYPVNSKNDQISLTRILTTCLLFIQLIEKLYLIARLNLAVKRKLLYWWNCKIRRLKLAITITNECAKAYYFQPTTSYLYKTDNSNKTWNWMKS